MAKKKSTRTSTKKTTVKSTKKAVAAQVSLSLHKPGSVPEDVKIAAGTTVRSFISDFNLKDYVVSHNGSEAIMDNIINKGDTIRVGLKTKNA